MRWSAEPGVGRPGSRVAPVDLALAVVVFIISTNAPPGGRSGVRAAGLDPVDVAARGWESMALVVLACLLLVWRRRWPMGVWVLILALAAIDTLMTSLPSRCLLALLVAVYSLAVVSSRRTAVAVAAATSVTLVLPALTATGASMASDSIYVLVAFSALAAAVGDSVRNQRESVASALARADAAEASREEEARRQVAEERLRIARELHDAVAHHVSVINVQAGVASHLLEADPCAAREALANVRAAGREVIEEMRVTVGLLRTEGNAQVVEPPTPGLSDIPGLLVRLRAAGLDVEFDDRVGSPDLPATTGLTAYRVIQEALTNAARYGTGTASVVLAEEGDTLHVEVSNPVLRPATDSGGGRPASGHGLIGMRERVAATGGRLTVTEGDRFLVAAALPLDRVNP